VRDDAEQRRAAQRYRDAADDERHMGGIGPSKYRQESPHMSSPGRIRADKARLSMPMHHLAIRLTPIWDIAIAPTGREEPAKHFSRRVTG
jgi:hypothetical protein